MGLGVRELVVLLACGLVLLVALTQEGDLTIEPAWFQSIEYHHATHTTISGSGPDLGQMMATYANGVAPAENELVPAPLITDLDGDGLNEVVLVTREPKLKVFKFKVAAAAGAGGGDAQNFHLLYSNKGIDWDKLELVHEVGLLSSLLITSGRQAVGLSSGYLRPYSSTRNRKQVVVVVNESFGIFVFNHKLKLMWTRTIESDLSHRYLAEVAIMIDPHSLRRDNTGNGGGLNDTGVVVVGGRFALKSEVRRDAYGLHRETPSAAAPPAGPQPLEFPADYAEPLQGRILRPSRRKGYMTVEEATNAPSSSGEDHFDRAAHFSYYAFAGGTGESRWTHDSTSFLEEQHAHDLLRPQHEAVHSGESDWRLFRRSILDAALPHAWQGGRSATRLDLAHVEKTRSGQQRQAIKASREVKSSFFVPNVLGLRPHHDSEHVRDANALVAHLRDGIEILHLYSGRPLCRLTLQAGQVHVDMDGDGVIDHVEAVGGVHSASTRNAHDAHAIRLPKCLAMVHAGVPPKRQLFNASICETSWTDLITLGPDGMSPPPPPSTEHGPATPPPSWGGRTSASAFSLEGGAGSTEDATFGGGGGGGGGGRVFGNLFHAADSDQTKQIRVAHPIVIQDPRTAGKTAKKRRFHSFFFLSNGLVTSFNHDGSRTWHTRTRAAWLRQRLDEDAFSPGETAFRPSLVEFPLRADTPADHVLVVGERSVALLSFGGQLRAEVLLERDLVVAPPVVGDFDSDGLSDFILVTTKGFYAYSVRRRVGSHLFTALAAGLVLLLAVVAAVKVANGEGVTTSVATLRANLAAARHGTPQPLRRTTFTAGLRPATFKSAKAQM